jgi:hypothetical protein
MSATPKKKHQPYCVGCDHARHFHREKNLNTPCRVKGCDCKKYRDPNKVEVFLATPETLHQQLSKPTMNNLFARMHAFVYDADRLEVLARASYLEGTLRLPEGKTARFEWDAEADGPFRPFFDAVLRENLPRKKS